MAELKQYWETKDGSVFQTKEEAESHETDTEFRDWYETTESVHVWIDDIRVSAETLLDFIRDNCGRINWVVKDALKNLSDA